jgi:phosphomannomutase
LCALVSAAVSSKKVSEVFAALPARYTGGGLIDDVPDAQIAKFRELGNDIAAMQKLADAAFAESSLGAARLDITDGLRLIFESGDVIHLRPSGNAPQFRVYTNASTQQRADELTNQALDPEGFITKLLGQLEV